MMGLVVIFAPLTQRPLRRTWIETGLECVLAARVDRHNVLFGGRGLKLYVEKCNRR